MIKDFILNFFLIQELGIRNAFVCSFIEILQIGKSIENLDFLKFYKNLQRIEIMSTQSILMRFESQLDQLE